MKKYKDYAAYMAEKFPGVKVQKISINAGFSCPNRDGTIGRGGCIYCDNTSFTPGYCFADMDVVAQIEAGKKFFSRKYRDMKFLAYFQSFSNTFGKSACEIESIYNQAADVEDIIGIIVGTRPDTIPDDVLTVLERLNKRLPVFVELGAETSHDSTLKLINRGHAWANVVETVHRLKEVDLSVGLHFIMGLPGETEEMQLQTVERAVELPVESLKFHQLQILKNTQLARMLEKKEVDVKCYEIQSYLELCSKIIDIVPENIAIERFVASAPASQLLMPKWGLKNYEFMNLLNNYLKDN